MLSLIHVIEWRSCVTPDRVALSDHLGAELSYHELAAAVDRSAARYAAAGIAVGDVVPIIARNRAGWVTAMFGLVRLGALPAAVNWRLAAPEVSALLALMRSGAAIGAVVTDDDCEPLVKQALAGLDGPQPATLRLEDEQDRPGERAGRPSLGWEVRIGESGEIQVRGAAPLPGYWNDPQATSESLTGDGFCRTGDVGVIDADGYLTVIDRLKDMIITGGENVYPAEVEAVLARHPDVAEVAVIGLPDDRWGETVHAAELPRNATGKVLKSVLREPHWSGRDRQVS